MIFFYDSHLASLVGIKRAENSGWRGSSTENSLDKFYRCSEISRRIRQSPSLEALMTTLFLKLRTNYLLGLVTALSLGISAPALWAQQDKDPIKAWATIEDALGTKPAITNS